MLPNSPEFLATWLGLARIGVIEVPINTAYRGDLFAYILNKAECQAIVISSQWVDRLKDILHELTHLRHIIVVGENKEAISGKITWHSYEKLMADSNDYTLDVEINPWIPFLSSSLHLERLVHLRVLFSVIVLISLWLLLVVI